MEDSSLKILVVEDDERLQRQYQYVLRSAGHVTDGTSSSDEAIESLTGGDFDVALVDLELNGKLSGVLIAGKSVTDYPQTKVIVVTGRANIAYSQLGRQSLPGSEATLLKPVTGQELIATINQVCAS